MSILDQAAALRAANGPTNHFSTKTEQGSADLCASCLDPENLSGCLVPSASCWLTSPPACADFHYYGMLQHQQNMLQDYVRTATYHQAIMDNAADFQGKLVMDVGAGTGILSLFAAQVRSCASAARLALMLLGCALGQHPTLHCTLSSDPARSRQLMCHTQRVVALAKSGSAQAGAAKVYAVEASDMAGYAQSLADANPGGLGAPCRQHTCCMSAHLV